MYTYTHYMFTVFSGTPSSNTSSVSLVLSHSEKATKRTLGSFIVLLSIYMTFSATSTEYNATSQTFFSASR